MSTAAIRKKLVDYLQTADDKKVKAIYTMVEDEINTQANDWDAAFITEINNRKKSYDKGKAETYTWEQTKKAALDKIKSNKK